MSTKTSIKRIALVAVSALGFGLLSVTSASATVTEYVQGTVTLDQPTTTYAGRVGNEVSITVRGDVAAMTGSTGRAMTLSVAAAITSQPSGSAVYPSLISSGANVSGSDGLTKIAIGRNFSVGQAATTAGSSTGTASLVAQLNMISADGDDSFAADADETLGSLKFTPTHTGTYTLVVWNEASQTISVSSQTGTASANAALSGAESSQTFTVNVSSGVSTVTLTPTNATASAAGTNGSLVKVSLRDASGNAAVLAPGESITLTPSGTGDIAGVNGAEVTSTAGAAYNLAATDFNSSGVAWINVTAATEQTVNLTASISGGATTSTTLSFKDVVSATAPRPYSATSTGYVLASGSLYSIPKGTTSITWAATTGSAGAYANYTVIEELVNSVGAITGFTTALAYDRAVASAAATAYAVITSVDNTASDNVLAYNVYLVDAAFKAAGTVGAAAQGKVIAGGVLSASPTLVNSAVGASNTISATYKDIFGRAYPYQTVSASVTGKNPTTSARTAVTDADGKVSFTFTDANTNTSVSDLITFTSGSTTTTTITYGTNAVGTVTLEYPNEDDIIAGTTFTEISAAGAGATGTSAAVTAIVTGSTGALLAGVPVTFAVSGLTGAEVHTTKVTVYTNTSGQAATSISSYAAGKATVTATAGGVSSTADIYFKQTGATEARTIAAAVSGSVVTATVKDRYGNTIEGVTVNATRTGSGYFGSGASTASGNTDKNGVVEFIFTGTGTVTVAFTSADYGQSADAAGKVGITAVTASAAGTTTTNQTGLGAALAPAGVNSASVAVASVDAAAAAAEAASDAAAEAIDAANAATDAANLAAEAADAATVAAEEARDAADAATAAVEELATQVATLMAALKAQITTLANTVAKIAKKVKA